LNLLEGQAQPVGEVRLTHAQHYPTHAQAIAHVLIDGIWGLRGHDGPSYGRSRPLTGNQLRAFHPPGSDEGGAPKRVAGIINLG
jgi:hypothetical protein